MAFLALFLYSSTLSTLNKISFDISVAVVGGGGDGADDDDVNDGKVSDDADDDYSEWLNDCLTASCHPELSGSCRSRIVHFKSRTCKNAKTALSNTSL